MSGLAPRAARSRPAILAEPDASANAAQRLLHVTGIAHSLRQPRTMPLHRIELLWLQRADEVRLHGSVLGREQQTLVHFDTHLNTAGRLERHTVFLPAQRWQNTISYHAGDIELVQTVQGRSQGQIYRCEQDPVTESTLPCYIQANWSRLMQGYRCVLSLIRLPNFSMQPCEIFKGDDYWIYDEHRVDFVLRFLESPSQHTCLPVVLTFAVASKHLLAFEGAASYTGGIAVPVSMRLATRVYSTAAITDFHGEPRLQVSG